MYRVSRLWKYRIFVAFILVFFGQHAVAVSPEEVAEVRANYKSALRTFQREKADAILYEFETWLNQDHVANSAELVAEVTSAEDEVVRERLIVIGSVALAAAVWWMMSDTNTDVMLCPPLAYKAPNGTPITVVPGSVQRQFQDLPLAEKAQAVIVNAANKSLGHGGLMCGDVYKAAGTGLDSDTTLYPAMGPNFQKGSTTTLGGDNISGPEKCPPGNAVISQGHALAPVRIIHAVVPSLTGTPTSADEHTFKQAHIAMLQLAAAQKVSHIAIPSIGTGVFGWPVDRAAQLAVDTIQATCVLGGPVFKEIRMVAYDNGKYNAFKKALSPLAITSQK